MPTHWDYYLRSCVCKVPPKPHPLLVPFWEEMIRRKLTYSQIAKATGIPASTIFSWRRGRKGSTPDFINIQTALEFAGLHLVVLPIPQAKYPNTSELSLYKDQSYTESSQRRKA